MGCVSLRRCTQSILQGDVGGGDGGVEEEGGHAAEAGGILGGEVGGCAATAAAAFHLGVPTQVVGKAVGHDCTLLDDGDARWHVLPDFGGNQRVVGAAEYYAVDVGALCKQCVGVFFHEIVGTRAVGFLALDERHPQWAFLPECFEPSAVHLFYFHVVGTALDSSGSAEYADVAVTGDFTYFLHGGADYAQHAASGVDCWQVVLLYRAKSLGRCCVASQYHKLATTGKKILDSLKCEVIYNVERPHPVRGTGVVAEV